MTSTLPRRRGSRALMALAAVAAVGALAAATPDLAQPLRDPRPAAASSPVAQPVPLPSSATGPVRLTAMPDIVQSQWLYDFAATITAGPADADSDQCVRHDGVYGESTGMQPQRQTMVLHPDSSAQMITWMPPKVSYRRFAAMSVGEIDFTRGKATRDHAATHEMAFPLGFRLPTTESELMQALLHYYGAVPPQTQPSMTAIDVLSTIANSSFGQAPSLANRAAMLRLIARLPGTHVNPQAQDPLLRLTIAVTMSTDDGVEDRTAYFDPATAELLAWTEVIRAGYSPRGARLPYFREVSMFAFGCHQPGAATVQPKRIVSGRTRLRLAGDGAL